MVIANGSRTIYHFQRGRISGSVAWLGVSAFQPPSIGIRNRLSYILPGTPSERVNCAQCDRLRIPHLQVPKYYVTSRPPASNLSYKGPPLSSGFPRLKYLPFLSFRFSMFQFYSVSLLVAALSGGVSASVTNLPIVNRQLAPDGYSRL